MMEMVSNKPVETNRPPRFSARRRVAVRKCLSRSTVSVGGGRSPHRISQFSLFKLVGSAPASGTRILRFAKATATIPARSQNKTV
jgi:hypothetical protein